MSDRYTSPETSRLLAEAGLEQWKGDVVVTVYGRMGQITTRSGEPCSCPDCRVIVRALDLTDVLHELTRPRPEEKDARPLCDEIGLMFTLVEDSKVWACSGDDDDGAMYAKAAVDAAALVLLALLKERK